MQRLVVVGTSGSGKTTLAMQVAEKLGYPFVELDALFWKPNWVAEENEVFSQKLHDALSGSHWAVAGNYFKSRGIIWRRADTLVWLDYSLLLVMGRLLRRTLRRVVTQEELWSGNRETWRGAFWDKDNLFRYALKAHARYRQTLPIEFQRDEYQHLQVLRFRNPIETEKWVRKL